MDKKKLVKKITSREVHEDSSWGLWLAAEKREKTQLDNQLTSRDRFCKLFSLWLAAEKKREKDDEISGGLII